MKEIVLREDSTVYYWGCRGSQLLVTEHQEESEDINGYPLLGKEQRERTVQETTGVWPGRLLI